MGGGGKGLVGTQKLKYILSIPSPMPVRVVGGEWKSGGSRWNQDFQGLHMADSQARVCQLAAGAPQLKNSVGNRT